MESKIFFGGFSFFWEDREEDRVFYPGRIPGQIIRVEYLGRGQGHPPFGGKEERRSSCGAPRAFLYYELLLL
jgi:hypothetical protein